MGLFDGLIDPNAVGGAFATGLKHGQQERETREVKGALSAYAVNPDDPKAFRTLAQYQPELAIKIGEQQRKRAQEQQIQRLTAAAAQGDKSAAAQLAGVDLDAWSKIDTHQRAQIKDRVDYIGQAALAVSRLPEGQRAQAWDQYIDQGVQAGHDDLAAYRGKYSPDALNAAIANAGQVKTLIDLTEPHYQTVPEGGSLVNTNDPAAVQSFVNGQPAANIARPASKAEFDALPPGAEFIAPDGSHRQKPGGQTARPSGTFRPVNNGAAVIQQLFPGARITDNKRPANSALGRANPSSWHVRSGGAVDVAPIPGMTFDQYVSKVKAAGYNIIEAIDEVKNPSSHATGPHWHIVIGNS